MPQRHTEQYSVSSIPYIKQLLLLWAQRYDVCCFLDSHSYTHLFSSFDCLLAVEPVHQYVAENHILPTLQQFIDTHNDWLFGHLNYQLKNETEPTHSYYTGYSFFPTVFLFQPATVIQLKNNLITIHSIYAPKTIWKSILNSSPFADDTQTASVSLQPRISKETYIATVQNIQQQIQKGNCYEMNYCIDFFAKHAYMQPELVYEKLMKLASAPFAAYYKLHNNYALCASPERFLKKTGNTIVSQPIKGTAPVKNNDFAAVERKKLYNNLKERSENVMIVDLVRNDFSKICKEGSVHVQELFGIYSFPQVHQMISTIVGTLKNNCSFTNILQATFPAGSMTGAPKRKVIMLTDDYESQARSLYSGSIGYITPEGDFDWNVVIRTLLYNSATGYASYGAGSAITHYSQPEKEWDECLLKAKAIQQALK